MTPSTATTQASEIEATEYLETSSANDFYESDLLIYSDLPSEIQDLRREIETVEIEDILEGISKYK